jgi:membrane-bound metal-dependent hydrolase YbcI (DUF457 family)
MTAPNHIAGSLVFTGTMCSFWNINIFASVSSVLLIALFSILPDIDNPKAIAGRCVYPIALAINRQFGHRTITHSLFFLVATAMGTSFIVKLMHGNDQMGKIIFFSLSSHLILDMLTLHGVPLLYPFKRNPCVMPGNPDYRLHTGNIKTEGIVFTIFILMGITLLPLFNQGFWTSYNREFATIAHCNRENKNATEWILCEYCYIKNSKLSAGEGFIIGSDENKLSLFDRKQVFSLSSDDRSIQIIFAKPRHSSFSKCSNEITFTDIAADSLNQLLKNRVCSGTVQANHKFSYSEKAIIYYTSYLPFSERFNFYVSPCFDSTRQEISQKLTMVCARISKDSLAQMEPHHWYEKNMRRQKVLARLIDKLWQYDPSQGEFSFERQMKIIPSSDLQLIGSYVKELKERQEKTKYFELKPYTPDIVMESEKKLLIFQLNERKPVRFNGNLTFEVFDRLAERDNMHHKNTVGDFINKWKGMKL